MKQRTAFIGATLGRPLNSRKTEEPIKAKIIAQGENNNVCGKGNMIINTKADWSQNRGHDSAAQFSIWHCLMMLSPLEIVNADIDGFDAVSITEGQKDFYVFMKTLYEDMYAKPDKYIIPTTAYDEYMKREGTDERLSNEHKMDSKENKLRLEFQQAIQFYPDYFYQLGLQADDISKENFAFVIEKSKYDKVLKALDTTHTRKDNHRRHTAITNQGIEVKEIGDTYHILCERTRKMFIGLFRTRKQL